MVPALVVECQRLLLACGRSVFPSLLEEVRGREDTSMKSQRTDPLRRPRSIKAEVERRARADFKAFDRLMRRKSGEPSGPAPRWFTARR